MLCNNHPAISYISWFGLVIIDEAETPYMVNTGKSCMKYIYWDMDNPYVLRESNTWIEESPTRKMIYINDNGTGTEVPHDNITIYYNDTGSGGASVKLVGEALGKYDELNGKYMIVQEDVNGIKEVLGSTETGSGNSLIERINVLEKTAEGTTEKISTVEKKFSDNKELEDLRNNINISLINLGEALSYYENSIGAMSKDLEVSSEEKSDISVRQSKLLDAYTVLSQYHQVLIQRLEKSQEDNSTTITRLNNALDYLNTSISNLNSIVNTAISDNTIVPSEVTTMLSAIATVALRNSDYKTLVSDSILLGIGGRLIESVLDIKKTSNEFSQTVSKVVEEIDGETGLKVQVSKNATAIKQNADTISLECVKFNETTAQLTVGDGVIKLDASKVLMTGTLTWDSLDDEAKTNLKGADGTAEYVMLIGDQIFKYDKDLNPNVTYITLSAQLSNIKNPTYDWYYRNDNNSDWIHISSNTNLSSFTLRHDDSIWGSNANSITIRVTCNGLSDDMTIVKLYDGLKGQDSKTVTVNGEQLFKYDNDFTGTPNPTSITLTGYKNNITSTASRWYYRVSETDSWTEITSARSTDNLTITHDSSYFGSSRILMIKYEVETYSDVISIAKISDGSDGYFVLLTNENHSVPCDENGNYDSGALNEAYTYVRVYKGLDEVSFTLTKTDNGCVSIYNTSTKKLEITSLTNNVATVTMNITIDGNSFQKVMTITKSIKGDKGEDGTGVNVLGQLDNVSQLPTNGTPGDAYIIDGLIYVWSENTNGWSDGVPFRGEQGLPGKNGADGRTTYLHIKYSNDGKTFTSNNGEDVGDWLGQYTDYIETDSTNFSDYKWKKIVGEDGDNGIVANLTNDNHIVPTESDGTFGSTSFEGCSSKISLSYNGVELTSGVTYGYTVSTGITGTWDSTTGTYTVTGWTTDNYTGYVDLKAIYNGVTYTKRFTISKSKKPLDSYTIVLTNESHTFAGDVSNALASSTTCGIIAYRGTELAPTNIGTISNIPTGMTVTINNNNTTNTILNIHVNTSMTSANGTLNIPITVGTTTLTKVFTYSISFKGSQGEQGLPGLPGKDGKDGNSVRVLGRYDTLEQLNSAHPSGNENGDGYIVDKDLWVWTDTKFINVGQFQGEDGSSAYVHIKYSNDGKTFTSNSGEDIGSWIGMYTDNIQADSTVFSDYKWSKIEGTDAKFLSISASKQTVAFNNDNTAKDSTAIVLIANQQNFSDALTWTTNPSVTLSGSGNNRTLAVSNFTNNNQIVVTVSSGGFTDSVTIVKVMDGQRGEDGTSVKILDTYDTLEQLNSAHPSGNENGDGYMVGKDLYVWNGTSFINVGQIRGNDGVDGKDGANGTNAYVHIKYSNDGGKTFTSNNGETTGDYMGVYTDNIQADSTNPSDYNWSLTKGNDGWDAYTIVLTNESHTFTGTTSNALSSSTTCGIIAYKGGTQVPTTIGSITGQPTGMTTSITNNNSTNAYFTVDVTTSMTSRNGVLTIPITVDGVTFTKRFTYSLSLSGANGSNGADAKLLSLSANRQAIAFNNNNKAKDSTAITLTAIQQNFSDTITWSTNPSVTLSGSGLTRTLAVSSFNSNQKITVTITAGGMSDTVTLVKVIDGNNGADGQDGTNGTDGADGVDGYTINLSNDNHTFIANSSGNIETQQSTTTIVTAYKGTTPVTPTIGTLPTVNGLSISRSGTTITINATIGTNLATHGSFNIPVTIDGNTFSKAFSYSKVNCGENGDDAYTVILTNEAHIFPCANNGSITSAISTTTQVRAFRGTTEVTPTIGTLPSVTGLTLSKSGTTITVQANVGTSLASSGSFNIPITVNGISFTKTFSWSKSFAGANGTFEGEIPEWITEWDNGKTTINGSTVLTPKLFAGTITYSVPTGVAIGKNVFGTSGSYSDISGIVGYKNGNKTYHLSTDGNFLVGTTSGNHISWDGDNLEIKANSITTYSGISLDSVASTANNAQSTADNANTTANSAQSTANSAQSTASSAQSTANNAYSLAQQTENKFSWIVNGTSSTSFTLTDRMSTLITEKVNVQASSIKLTGSIDINNGTFTVDTSGNFKASKGSLTGVTVTSNSGSDITIIDGGYIECEGTTTRYWLGSYEGSLTTKLKSENGRFRARNDNYNRSVYFSDQGLSTTADGELGSSGIIDFHNDWYGYGNKGITMYSNHHVGLISYNGYVNISPEWNNTGNNTFSFQVYDASSGGASDTDGLIYYGSHRNGYSTVLRISKDASDPYLQVLNSSLGSNAKLMAEYVKTTMVNNNYFTNGTLTMNRASQGTQGGSQTYLSGTVVSATKFYQNGSSVSTSDIILKDNIKEYIGDALDIINKTKIYTFNRINDHDREEIGFIAQEMPDELIYQKGRFTAKELEGLTAEEKTALLEKATAEYIEETKIKCYDELAYNLPSFYDLDEEATKEQICTIQETMNNLEYTSPVYMLNQNNIIAIMFKGIQELKEEIDKLKNK